MSTSPMHLTPGRLRLRSAAVKRSASKALTVQWLMGQVQGVLRVEVNHVTGSVLVCFDPALVTVDGLVEELGRSEDARMETPVLLAGRSDRSLVRAVGRSAAKTVADHLTGRLLVVLLTALVA